MLPIKDRIKEESKIIKIEVQERMLGFITGAFGLVAGLAWNDAIKALIEYAFPLGRESIWAKFIYATLISCVVVLLTITLVRLFKRNEK